MDLFAFEFVLNKRKVDLKDVTPVGDFSLKPLIDFLVFAKRSNLIG